MPHAACCGRKGEAVEQAIVHSPHAGVERWLTVLAINPACRGL
jgi:hypothetical protein